MSMFYPFHCSVSLLAAAFALVMLPCASTTFAQNLPTPDSNSPATDSTTAESAGVQAAYDRMTLAYELLDVDAAASAYAEEARYILPDPEREVVEGRESIREVFDSFFRAARMRQAEITIEFRFVSRNIYDDMAHDVGYYRVTGRRKGEIVSTSTGKFATVLSRSEDGMWRFMTDAYSPAPDSAFDALDRVPSTVRP